MAIKRDIGQKTPQTARWSLLPAQNCHWLLSSGKKKSEKIYDNDRSGFSLVLFFTTCIWIQCLGIRVSITTNMLSPWRFHIIFAAIKENKREHIYEIVFILQNHISISTFWATIFVLRLVFLWLDVGVKQIMLKDLNQYKNVFVCMCTR